MASAAPTHGKFRQDTALAVQEHEFSVFVFSYLRLGRSPRRSGNLLTGPVCAAYYESMCRAPTRQPVNAQRTQLRIRLCHISSGPGVNVHNGTRASGAQASRRGCSAYLFRRFQHERVGYRGSTASVGVSPCVRLSAEPQAGVGDRLRICSGVRLGC